MNKQEHFKIGSFNQVTPINIHHKNFDENHNLVTFQTTDLEPSMSEYSVFNGIVFINYAVHTPYYATITKGEGSGLLELKDRLGNASFS
jgi:hypothetical protein